MVGGRERSGGMRPPLQERGEVPGLPLVPGHKGNNLPPAPDRRQGVRQANEELPQRLHHPPAPPSGEDNSGHHQGEVPDNLPTEESQVLGLVNDGGRVQNPEDESAAGSISTITNMRKDLRQHLRVDGERLMEADVRNCQPLALVAVLEEQGVECPEYRRLCEEGTLYEFLAERAGVSREQAKRELIACAFFGRNGSRSPTKTAFGKAFPKAARAIREIKRKDYTELARRLQKAESSVIVRTACETGSARNTPGCSTPRSTTRSSPSQATSEPLFASSGTLLLGSGLTPRSRRNGSKPELADVDKKEEHDHAQKEEETPSPVD